jgi:hypothetical protein
MEKRGHALFRGNIPAFTETEENHVNPQAGCGCAQRCAGKKKTNKQANKKKNKRCTPKCRTSQYLDSGNTGHRNWHR